MFEPGTTPGAETSRWSTRLSRFFKEHGFEVTSHDFRTTMITAFYEETKDLAKTKELVNHRDVRTTMGYVKINKDKMEKETAQLVDKLMPRKRTRKV